MFSETRNYGLIKQGTGGYAGVDIFIYNHRLYAYLEMSTRGFSRAISPSNCPTEPFSTSWQFIALTYDAATDSAYIKCNNFQMDMQPHTHTSNTPNSFWFGYNKFLLDEVFYVSKFYDEQSLTKIQEMSKTIFSYCTIPR